MVDGNSIGSDANRRDYLKALLGGSAGLALAGCVDQDQAPENSGNPSSGDGSDTFRVTFTQGAGAVTLDPHNHSTPETYDAHGGIYEQLGFTTREGDVIPWLAEDWERLDELRVKFYIREGVTFHNGEELTPEDVEYSIKRIADDDFGIVSPQSSSYVNITEYEIVDEENAIILGTEDPDVLLISKLGNGAPIGSKSFIESRSESELATEANGTGPYVVTEFEADNVLTAELNEDYWDYSYLTENGFPQVTEFSMEAVPESSTRASRAIAGESDITTRIASADFQRLDEEGLLDFYTTDRSEYIKMKTTVSPFDSLEVRKAFNYAVDKQAMNDAFFDGQATLAGQPVPPSWIGHNSGIEPYPYDLDRALELMGESAYAGEQIELDLHTAVGALANDLDIAETVASNLNEIPNVDVSVTERDFSSIFDTLRGPLEGDRPDFYRSDTGGSPGEAIAGKLFRMHHQDGSGTAWRDEETSQLIDDAQSASTIEEREQISQEAAQVIHDKCPEIFLWWRPSAIAISDRVAYETFEDQSFYMQEVEDTR
jgi:peptide/nickel transport system substrate-binding protein